VELLVKQHLVGTPDQTVARRIVRLLIEEHIKVPRLWLEGADPRVLAQLGSLVTGAVEPC
jgi:hypothetical protein